MELQVEDRSDGAAPTRAAGVGIAGIAGIVLLLALVAVVVPLVVAVSGDAFGIPRSDDWSYLLTLFRFADTGRISFNNWVSMTLIGQVVLSAPVALVLERSVRAVQVLTALVGLGGLLAVVGLGRRLGVRTGRAVFVAVMVAVGPLWAPLAVSYMTDVPAFTAGMVTLLLGVIGLRRRPVAVGWVVAALAAGFVAFSIRQYAIVPGVAVAIVAGWSLVEHRDHRRLRQVAIAAGTVLVAAGILFLWWRGYSNAKSLSPALPTPHSVWDGMLKGTEFLRLLGLLVAPALFLAHPVRLVRRSWDASRSTSLVLGGVMLVLQVGVFARVRATPFLGNYVARDGVLARGVLEGARPDVLPRALFDLLVLIGAATAVVLALAVVPFVLVVLERWRDRRFGLDDPVGAVVVLTILGYAASYVLAVVTKLPLYDRYVLPFVPLVAFLLLREHVADRPPPPADPPAADPPPAARSGRGALVGAGIALVLLAGVGLAFSLDSAAFDGTRWHVAQLATDAGYPARKVNGGFEWVNSHRGTWKQRSASGELVAARRQGQAQYCVVVVVNPGRVAPDRVIARAESELPFRDREEFVALRTNRSCPAADERAGR